MFKVMLAGERFSLLLIESKILNNVLLVHKPLSIKMYDFMRTSQPSLYLRVVLAFLKKSRQEYLSKLKAFELVKKKWRGLSLSSIIYIKSFLIWDAMALLEVSKSKALGYIEKEFLEN